MPSKRYEVTIERGQRKSDIIPLDRAVIQLEGMKSTEGTAGGEGGKELGEKDRPAFELVSAGPGASQLVLEERFEGTLVATFTGEVGEEVEIPHAAEQQSGRRGEDDKTGMVAGVRDVTNHEQAAPKSGSKSKQKD